MRIFNFLALAASLFFVSSCGAPQKSAESDADSQEAFFASQPVESGVYDASYFDIKGKNPRKGQFDGRIIVSLSPEQSAVFVYENGNRTKIKHILMLDSAFEKTDGDVFTSVSKGLPVTLTADSASYLVSYITNNDTVAITFSRKPRTVCSPLEALEKIQQEASR